MGNDGQMEDEGEGGMDEDEFHNHNGHHQQEPFNHPLRYKQH